MRNKTPLAIIAGLCLAVPDIALAQDGTSEQPQGGVQHVAGMSSDDHGNMAQNQSYAGWQDREIKALSDERIEGLQSGKGIGYALAAELNSYPGPRHALQFSQELGLSGSQIDQIQIMFDTMQAGAISLGVRVIEAEASLDRAFADQSITQDSLTAMVAAIATIESALRRLHLSTHLDMRNILSPHQIKLYDDLRGYAQGGGEHQGDMRQNYAQWAGEMESASGDWVAP